MSNVNNNEISQSQEAELKKHTEQSPASGRTQGCRAGECSRRKWSDHGQEVHHFPLSVQSVACFEFLCGETGLQWPSFYSHGLRPVQ